jgi:hypothetical protein
MSSPYIPRSAYISVFSETGNDRFRGLVARKSRSTTFRYVSAPSEFILLTEYGGKAPARLLRSRV